MPARRTVYALLMCHRKRMRMENIFKKNNGINLPKSEKENGKSIGYQMRQIQTGPHQNTLESTCQKLKAKRQCRKKQ